MKHRYFRDQQTKTWLRITAAALLALGAVRTAHAGLLFDNMSGYEHGLAGSGSAYAFDGTADDTFVGSAYNLPAGTTDITGFDLDPQNGTILPITYLQLNVYVWGTVNMTGNVNASNPAFSNLLGQTTVNYNFGLNGFPAGYDAPFETGSPGATPAVTFPTPLTLPTGETTIGLTYNFKISTDGINYTNVPGVTSTVAFGVPPTTGSGIYGFYLNTSGETNANFIENTQTFGNADEMMAARIFGDVAPGIRAQWNNALGGDWTSAANWAPATVPNSGRDAFFNLSSSASYTVTIPTINQLQDLYVQNDKVTLSLTTSTAALVVGDALDVGVPSTYGTNINGNLTLSHPAGGSFTNVSAGTVMVGGNGGTGTLTVTSGVNLIVTQFVSISAGSLLAVRPNGKLSTPNVSISGGLGAWTAQLDLGTGWLDLAGGSLTTVNDQVTQAYNASGGGNWKGNGITSSIAAADTAHQTAIGVILNNVGGGKIYGSGTPLGLFNGTNPGLYDVLVRYTYYGDANLDGKVDGSDYSLIDSTYSNEDFEDGVADSPISGWYNGDFNYDGIVDGSDYTLIDDVFNQIGSTQLGIGVATVPTAIIASTTVPEPESFIPVSALLLTLSIWRKKMGRTHCQR